MTVETLRQKLSQVGYIADDALATTVWLMQQLQRPLLLEGDAGVGKTALAGALAEALNTDLIRLQCYEGIEIHQALYDWNIPAQLLNLKLAESQNIGLDAQDLYSEAYLIERPLLLALRAQRPPVLLIDEVDRADEAFEAFLLELLSEYQISIPELGTIRAHIQPLVILTANATRSLSDALRRRCLYYYLDYPSLEHELTILRNTAPTLNDELSLHVVRLVHGLRGRPLRKKPGIAETIDLAASLKALGVPNLQPMYLAALKAALPSIIKTRDDQALLEDATLADLMATVLHHHVR